MEYSIKRYQSDATMGSKMNNNIYVDSSQTSDNSSKSYRSGSKIEPFMRLDNIGQLSYPKKNTKLSPDITNRIEELSNLKNGWFNGKGISANIEQLRWLENQLDTLYDRELPIPKLYPTPDGNIQAEWSTKRYEISLEIILGTKTGEYQAVDLQTEESIDDDFDLNSYLSWIRINNELRKCLLN